MNRECKDFKHESFPTVLLITEAEISKLFQDRGWIQTFLAYENTI